MPIPSNPEYNDINPNMKIKYNCCNCKALTIYFDMIRVFHMQAKMNGFMCQDCFDASPDVVREIYSDMTSDIIVIFTN